jgi:hypothetical protein
MVINQAPCGNSQVMFIFRKKNSIQGLAIAFSLCNQHDASYELAVINFSGF